MANEPPPGGETGQLEALLERWQTSLDLHARYAALDDARYWHVQPWPRHERPQRWIIQLARKRILALKRLVAQRKADGDREFIEGIEMMGFLATLVGLTSLERSIPLATPETERREVLAARPEAPAEKPASPAAVRDRDLASRTGEHRRAAADTTRQMPRPPPGPRIATPRKEEAPAPAVRRRDVARPAVRPKKPPSTVTQMEHVVIADAVRLLGWGRQWHELAEMIARLAERPAPSEIRRILRTYRDQIDAVASRRKE